MAKYFGTDGIRGIYGEKLTSELSYKTGRAMAAFFGKGTYVIGRDTRVSGIDILNALSKGLTECGCTVVSIGILPTPAVAYLTKQLKAKCGIMISASHNPPEYNGIKGFSPNGTKLTDEQEASIEYYIDNPIKNSADGGKYIDDEQASRQKYIDYIVSIAPKRLDGLKVALDCGYGAASTVAEQIFTALGAEVLIENFKLRGEKINCGCGALYPYYVKNSIKDSDIKLGFSFDGDADRLSVVYEQDIIDGDTVLYNISRSMTLADDVVVGTILTNLALEQKLNSEGKRLIRTPVGDKYICDLMFLNKYNLGGEQSGHFIIYPAATTGDGILSAIFLAASVYNSGKVAKLQRLQLCPQKAIAEYASPAIMYDVKMQELIEKHTENLSGNGRLIVRMSGTEPKVRVMVECTDGAKIDPILQEFKKYINSIK